MYLAKTKKPSLGRVAVSAFHNNSDRKVSNMECDPHRLPPSRRCSQPPAVRAAPCIYRTTVFNKLQHLFHLAAASAAMPRPHAVRRQTSVTRASRSKARLRLVTNRRDSWRSHVHRTHTAQRVQFFELQSGNVRGRGGRPLVLSLGGCKGGYSLSRKRVSPFYALPYGAEISRACAEQFANGFVKPFPESLWQHKHRSPMRATANA